MTKISILIFLLSLIYNLNIYLASNLVDSNISEDNLLVNYVSNLAYNEIYSYIILFSAILSLVIGTILSLVQYRIKRLLAYSTIAHLGFLLICLYLSSPILDIDTYASSSIESYLFYLIQYSLTSCNNLLIVMAFGYMYFYIKKYFNNKYDASESINNIIYIDDLKGSF
jgi:NADH-ubiquinone oxidoreductase chain 2